MLTKRSFLMSSLAISGGLAAGVPALAGRDDHPFGDHPFNNPPYTFWLGDIRIERILPFFPELDPDGYPVGHGRLTYSFNGSDAVSKLKFSAPEFRRVGDLLIKGGTLGVEFGGQMFKGAVNLNDETQRVLQLAGAKQKVMLESGGKATKEVQDLAAGAVIGRLGVALAVGLAVGRDAKAQGAAVLHAKSGAGSAAVKVAMT